MSEPKYNIGEILWRASFEATDNHITCPDCGGSGQLTVTFHDGESVSIECEGCSIGYDPPTGRIRIYDRGAVVERITITGYTVGEDGVEYRAKSFRGGCYIFDEGDLFTDRVEAEKRGKELALKADVKEREQIANKEKPARTWAWNASYHRKQLKEANRNIVYHTAKLNAANLKIKAERKEKP